MRALALRAGLLGTVLLPHGAMAQSTPEVETRTSAALILANRAVTRARSASQDVRTASATVAEK